MFEVGEDVVLKNTHRYAKGKGNPVGIRGLVTRASGPHLYVLWDNGQDNIYKHTDLEPYDLMERMERYLEEYDNVPTAG